MKKDEIPSKIGELASRFGRRLSLTCIGMANHKAEDFGILEKMVQEANAYGSIASFNKPSMNANSLSQIISSTVNSSLTSTKTELTNLSSGNCMTVRTDLIRERNDAPDDLAPTDNWRLFNSDSQYTVNVWSWNHRLNHGDDNFSRLIEPRCSSCFAVFVLDTTTRQANERLGKICTICKACFFCHKCLCNGQARLHHDREVCLEMATARRRGAFMSLDRNTVIPSLSVAWKKKCFGEGAERVAFKFRFLDEEGNFTGPHMVAKESRFIDNEGIERKGANYYLKSRQHKYHLMFMRTQFLASKFAHKFNVTLDELKKRLNEMSHQPVLDRASKARFRKHRDDVERYPRIQFVQPQVFELVDKNERKTYNVLVEPMIAGKYKKYNNNKGGLVDQKFESPYVELDDNLLNPSLVKMLLGTKPESKEIMLSGENQNVTKKTGAAPMELLSVIAEDEEESETECDDSGINAEEDRNPEESTKEIFERNFQVNRSLTKTLCKHSAIFRTFVVAVDSLLLIYREHSIFVRMAVVNLSSRILPFTSTTVLRP